MAAEIKKDLSEFLSILNAWKFGYKTAWCKYFVSKMGDKPQLLYGMFAFTNSEITKTQKDVHVETSQFMAGQEIFDLDSKFYGGFEELLKKTPHIFKTAKQQYCLPTKHEQACSLSYDPLNFPLINSSMRNPFLRVSANSDYSLIPDVKVTSLELRNLEMPYDDVQDLFHLLGFSMEILQSNRIPHIEYIAAMPLQDMHCSIEDRKKLHMNFSFPSAVQKEKFRVGIRLFRKDRSDPRFSIHGKDFKWTIKDGLYFASLTKEIEDLEIARIFPSYDEHNLGAHVTIDPKLVMNNRPEVDAVFYGGRTIGDFLSSKNADEFEFGVSSLLHYYRLSVQRYAGVETLTDGPDLVAFSNSGHVYVIECTTGTPNHKGKLHKLHTRTEKLRSRYQEKGINQDLIRPVIFTNLPKENTSEDRADLANYKISLVTKDDFEEMIRRIPNPPSEQELFDSAIGTIPTKEPERQLPLAV